jgi:4-alpha-glucanotransferase
MPTFPAHWRGLDIDDRADLGLFTKAEARNERARRTNLILALLKFLRRNGWLKKENKGASPGDEIAAKNAETLDRSLQACLRWLCASPADLVLLNLEDLWEEERPQNVPGTSSERPNWRRKSRLTIEEMQATPELPNALRALIRRR